MQKVTTIVSLYPWAEHSGLIVFYSQHHNMWSPLPSGQVFLIKELYS